MWYTNIRNKYLPGLFLWLICNDIALHGRQQTEVGSVTIAKWNSAEAQIFVEHLNMDKITLLSDRIDALDIYKITAVDINNLNAKCSSILTEAANEAGFLKDIKLQPTKIIRSLKSKPVQRPWFNNECHRLRSQYKRAKNLRNRVNNVENYNFVHNASKAYKKCINKHFNMYKKDFITKLRSLKHSDPKKSYWSLLNKADSSRSGVIQKVSLETDFCRAL